jgi:benzil reductase ((S)-benzoin forming)
MNITSKSISIVTGGTGGLGRSISDAILNAGGKLLFVARDYDRITEYENSLNEESRKLFFKFRADLRNKSDIDRFKNYLIYLLSSSGDIVEIFLFNNASTIDPIALIEDIDFESISNALIVNIASAFALSSIVLGIQKSHKLHKANIINISSGVSMNPVKGWSSYCISKAGLNMLSRCIATENETRDKAITVLSINPGPINTEMQKKIRTANADKIPATKKFEAMFSENKLQHPKDVADKLFRILEEHNYTSGDFIDFNTID